MYNYNEYKDQDVVYSDIVGLEAVAPGERLFVEIDELPIVLFNIGGELFAIADVCSHDDGPVGEGDLDGHIITCPRHGAQFDVKSGKVLSLPAVVDIPAYPVRLVGQMIQVGIPKKEEGSTS